MKKNLVLPLVMASLALVAGQTAVAQQQPQAGPPSPVAIIDLAYVFKNHSGFQSMKEELKNSVDMAQADLKNRRDQAQQLAEQLQEYRPGSPEFKQLEATLAQKQADLNVQVALQKKTLMEREAKIYFTIYQEVIYEVKSYCSRNGIRLVLRFDGEPMNQDDPQQVVQQLNRQVVYSDLSIDITPAILDSLNRRRGPANGTGGQAFNPSSPQGVPRPQQR